MLSTLIGMNILSKTLDVFDAWAHESMSIKVLLDQCPAHVPTLYYAGRQADLYS